MQGIYFNKATINYKRVYMHTYAFKRDSENDNCQHPTLRELL